MYLLVAGFSAAHWVEERFHQSRIQRGRRLSEGLWFFSWSKKVNIATFRFSSYSKDAKGGRMLTFKAKLQMGCVLVLNLDRSGRQEKVFHVLKFDEPAT